MKSMAFWISRQIFLTTFLLAAFNQPCVADVIILQNGKTVAGTILQQDVNGVLVQLDYGTVRYQTPYIKEVKKESVALTGESESQRIPNWGRIISTLATNVWVQDIKQIPATVIYDGILNNVPYISFRCNGAGYEVNVYGDLDNPAGFEIGAVNHLNKNAMAKTNCIKFVATILKTEADKRLVLNLNSNGKVVMARDGITFEITQPDEPDAYGGWWISVYDTNALVKARVSGPELLAITQPKAEAKFQSQAPAQVTAAPEVQNWTPAEISYSRPRISYSSPDATSYAGSGDRVYVRGYTRKDGTYVSAHTRSKPSR